MYIPGVTLWNMASPGREKNSEERWLWEMWEKRWKRTKKYKKRGGRGWYRGRKGGREGELCRRHLSLLFINHFIMFRLSDINIPPSHCHSTGVACESCASCWKDWVPGKSSNPSVNPHALREASIMRRIYRPRPAMCTLQGEGNMPIWLDLPTVIKYGNWVSYQRELFFEICILFSDGLDDNFRT